MYPYNNNTKIEHKVSNDRSEKLRGETGILKAGSINRTHLPLLVVLLMLSCGSVDAPIDFHRECIQYKNKTMIKYKVNRDKSELKYRVEACRKNGID